MRKFNEKDYCKYIEWQDFILSLDIEEFSCGHLSHCNYMFAVYSLVEKQDLKQAKQHFYVSALLSAYELKVYNSSLFTYDIHSIGYAMLSDNFDFIKNVYAHLSFTDYYLDDDTEERIDRTMEDHVLDGEDGCVFVHTIQQFILGNNALIERNLKILERYLTLEQENKDLTQGDVDFFKALYLRDKSACEKALELMVSKKIHKARNTDGILKKYISMPALGYAKLAWYLGVEVEVDSPLIPKELLPIQPLERYEIPYDFLKEINWEI